MRITTLCYVERGDQYLMLHRVVKKNDENHDKWIGIGGHVEEGESPDECLRREVRDRAAGEDDGGVGVGVIVHGEAQEIPEVTQLEEIAAADVVNAEGIDRGVQEPDALRGGDGGGGAVFARRPPNTIAEIGTPFVELNSLDMQGQFSAFAVNLELGCAPFSPQSGSHFSPFQFRALRGGVLLRPSHQTVLLSRSWTTFVKIVSLFVVARALGFDFALVPGATPKKPYSGLTAQRPPSSPTRSHAISSPTHQTLYPFFLYISGGISIARFVLPQADGNAAEIYFSSPFGYSMPRISICSAIQPSFLPR